MRLFLAYDIDNEAKEYLLSKTKIYKKKFKNIRWVKPGNIHLTLKFLGEYDVPEDIVENIENLKTYKKIVDIDDYLNVERISGFPSINRTRVLVAILNDNEKLINNFFEIDKSLEKLGFKREIRDFKPHITLGRIKFPIKMFELEDVKYSIKLSKLKLYRSILKKDGPIYNVLHIF